MSVQQHAFAQESPLASQQFEGSVASSFSASQSPQSRSVEQSEIKLGSSITGKLAQCESLNTSGDLSTKPASRSSCTSPYAAQATGADSMGHNMVMIDQQELLELMQAKKMLDSQKNAQRANDMIFQGNPLATEPRTSWKGTGMGRISITPFESADCSEDIMESKLLPPDLLSCEDESSPKNKTNEQIQSFNSDFLEMPTECCAKLVGDGAPASRKQTEAEEAFARQTRVSTFGPFAAAGNQKPISEFKIPEDEPKTGANQWQDLEDSNAAPKYNSIFSECLFTQGESHEDPAMEQAQPSSIFSMLDQSQLQSLHQNLDAHFDTKKNSSEDLDEKMTGQDNKDNASSFEFPDGGWECSKCQNYNFKGRKECHRCKKPKTVKDTTGRPEHMFKPEQEKAALKAAKNKQKRINKAKKLKEAKALLEQQATSATENPELKDVSLNDLNLQLKKMTQERAGDWACQRCGNHNFSFRHVCNKCQLTLQENDEMLIRSEKNAQTAGFTCAGQTLAQSASQPQVYPNQMMPEQFVPQVPSTMSENVIHVHQYNTNCSFNTYQVPNQPFMAQQLMNQAGQMMPNQRQMPPAQPFYPCFPAQQQLPQWAPSAAQPAQWAHHS